jgi:lysophospholipase L1-like esterase
MCSSQLELKVIQLGWSGERAPGFEARLENDLLPFKPNVVTTCYGMNDGQYRAYEDAIGKAYRDSMKNIVERLKAAGVTVVVGSPGAVDTFSFKRSNLPPEVYNANLAKLRDHARDVAVEAGMPVANVHDAMIEAMKKAKPVLGEAYDVCGADGFHPRANGHVVMAYAFLKGLGFDGQIGAIQVDLKGTATASDGHRVLSMENGRVEIESSRYPFCFLGDDKSPDSTRSIVPFVPFNEELNRLVLTVKNLEAASAKVTWGAAAKSFPREQLEKGINLAAEFLDNPFVEAFRKVDEAVARKQAYETPLIKDAITRFRTLRQLAGDRADQEFESALDSIRKRLMARYEELHLEARAAVTPVKHVLSVAAE